MLLEVGADAEFVVKDYFSQVVDSTGQVLNPSGCTLEFVCGSDVEDEVAIDYGEDLLWWNVFCEEFGVSGLCASIASDEDVEAFFGCD